MIYMIPAIAALIIFVASIWGFRQGKDKFLEHFAPALITGFFLIGILPIANEIYWKRQKDYEICVQDREKRYSLMGSTAKIYTTIFKLHTRLYELEKERLKEEKMLRELARRPRNSESVANIYLNRLEKLDQLKSDLEKDLIQQQGQLGSDSALVGRYLPATLPEYSKLAKIYDERVSEAANFFPTKNDSLVKGVNDLVASMAEEVQRNENICN